MPRACKLHSGLGHTCLITKVGMNSHDNHSAGLLRTRQNDRLCGYLISLSINLATSSYLALLTSQGYNPIHALQSIGGLGRVVVDQ